MQNEYVEDLENRIEQLEEEVTRWQSIAEASCAFHADVPKRRWRLFRKRDPQLRTILFHKERGYMAWHDGYFAVDPEKALNVLTIPTNKFHNPEYFAVSTYFGGRHFPAWDCDTREEGLEVEKYILSLGVSFIRFQSSPGKSWYIADIPKRKIREACMVSKTSNLGDSRFVEASWSMKEFVLRGFNRDYQIRIDCQYMSNDQDHPYSRDDYSVYKKCSWLFEIFGERLKKYYEGPLPEAIGNRIRKNAENE